MYIIYLYTYLISDIVVAKYKLENINLSRNKNNIA